MDAFLDRPYSLDTTRQLGQLQDWFDPGPLNSLGAYCRGFDAGLFSIAGRVGLFISRRWTHRNRLRSAPSSVPPVRDNPLLKLFGLPICGVGLDPSVGGLNVEHPSSESVSAVQTRNPNDSWVLRGLAGASCGLGFFSTIVFWWTPFAGMLATVGLALGIFCLVRGVRGGLRGEHYALAGTALCAVSLSVALTLNQALRYLMWDQW